MCLTAGFNETFHKESEVLGFLERVKVVVFVGPKVI